MGQAGILSNGVHSHSRQGNTASGQIYQGKEARAAIVGRLAGWAKAQVFATQVADFCRDALRFHESSSLRSSLYEINLRHNPVGLRYVQVALQLGTSRTAESLSHELLHLGLSMAGRPLPESIYVPPGLVSYARHLIGIQAIVYNLLEHELIHGAFRFLGFDQTRFLTDLPAPPDYEEIAVLSSTTCTEAVWFPWWCSEYLRYWLSARHGLGNVASVYAERALCWGSRLYPSLREAVRQITGMVQSGVLIDRDLYPGSVNRLLQVMRLPGYSEWVVLKPADGGGPSVCEWRSEDHE